MWDAASLHTQSTQAACLMAQQLCSMTTLQSLGDLSLAGWHLGAPGPTGKANRVLTFGMRYRDLLQAEWHINVADALDGVIAAFEAHSCLLLAWRTSSFSMANSLAGVLSTRAFAPTDCSAWRKPFNEMRGDSRTLGGVCRAALDAEFLGERAGEEKVVATGWVHGLERESTRLEGQYLGKLCGVGRQGLWVLVSHVTCIAAL